MTSLWFENALLPTGWAQSVRVEIVDGLIVAVETEAMPKSEDERQRLALPGLANRYAHQQRQQH